MLNGSPMKKMNKSIKLPLIFILSHVMIYGLLSTFCFKVWVDEHNEILIYSNIAIEAVAVLFWLIASIKDPGFIQKPKDVDFM